MNNVREFEECFIPTEPVNGVKIPPLTELTESTTSKAADALRKAYKINSHLFNIDEPKTGELPEVKCFQDVLVSQDILLQRLNEALEVLMLRLGV